MDAGSFLHIDLGEVMTSGVGALLYLNVRSVLAKLRNHSRRIADIEQWAGGRGFKPREFVE